jgi:hypothetical protein
MRAPAADRVNLASHSKTVVREGLAPPPMPPERNHRDERPADGRECGRPEQRVPKLRAVAVGEHVRLSVYPSGNQFVRKLNSRLTNPDKLRCVRAGISFRTADVRKDRAGRRADN